MGTFADIAALAAQQHQVVAARQAPAKGVPLRTFYRHARRTGWKPLLLGSWGAPGARLDHASWAQAALLAVGGPARLTGASALWLRGIEDAEPDTVSLLVAAARHQSLGPGVHLIRSTTFDRVAHASVEGLSCVSVARAYGDHAAAIDVDGLLWSLMRGLRKRRCGLDELQIELERRRRFPGRVGLRQALGLLSGEISHSREERYARRLASDAGLGFLPHPYLVTAQGRKIAEVDLARPDLRYGGEVDGPPHLLPEVAAKDRRRDRELQRLDWQIDRFLWSDIRADPSGFVTELAAAIHLRERRLDLTRPMDG